MSLEIGLNRLGIVVASAISCTVFIGTFNNLYSTNVYYMDSELKGLLLTTVISFICSLTWFFIFFGMTKSLIWIIKGFRNKNGG
jgi:hypothetical protein